MDKCLDMKCHQSHHSQIIYGYILFAKLFWAYSTQMLLLDGYREQDVYSHSVSIPLSPIPNTQIVLPITWQNVCSNNIECIVITSHIPQRMVSVGMFVLGMQRNFEMDFTDLLLAGTASIL